MVKRETSYLATACPFFRPTVTNFPLAMYFLPLALLLFTAPVLPAGPDDDPDDNEKASKYAVQQPASDYATLYAPARGTFWFQFGYGTVNKLYDREGNMHDFRAPAAPGTFVYGQASTLILHAGGTYAVAQFGAMDVELGMDLSVARTEVTFDQIGTDDQRQPLPQESTSSSGLALQNLTVFGEIQRSTYALTLGFMADLGVDPDEQGEISNTDQAHALLFGLSGHHQFGSVRLFGGADYFLTLQNSEETGSGNVEYNPGNVVNLHAGAGVQLASSVELGAALLYRLRTAATAAGNEVRDSGYNLSLAPYVTYAPVGAPFQISLKGAVQREYYDYGYSISGENGFAPRLGATLTLMYRL